VGDRLARRRDFSPGADYPSAPQELTPMTELLVNIDVDDLEKAVTFYGEAPADPFGHGFCLIELLSRGYDEIADKESLRPD
jgi:hypothetical protein